MNKRFVASIVFASVLLSAASVYCAGLAAWEKNIFSAVSGRWHDMLYGKSNDWYASAEDMEGIYRQVASTYGVSTDEVRRIDNAGIDILWPTEEEQKALDELYKRFDEPDAANNFTGIHSEVANKYSITLSRLHELEYIDEATFGFMW
ncbi:MAG: hypothetical protein AUJ75_03025 [Candidatus Omnitrophica bacterium CG1_02_49_10]|nr:MAG: hypothetical protein AUJ75_03025 [Candidatus Omnitrophica bacterium CG1_02_49_10]